MFLKKLSLRHYRNYEQVEVEFKHQVNIFIGPNAQGKTNLLEAIYVIALTKSHRTHKDKELVGWNQEKAFLACELQKKYGDYQLELQLSQSGKKAKVNSLEQRKLSQFVGLMNVVMFAPEDLEIVKGSPGVRRRFLDMEIAQVQPGYMYDLLQYQKVLAQRNQTLKGFSQKQSSSYEQMLEIFNEQLANYGVKIMKRRQSFINKLQAWAAQIHLGITNGQEDLKIIYQPSFECGDLQDESVLFTHFMIKLSQVKQQEIKRGMSLVGPHRDDLLFYINDKEAQVFGSQGQQRTTALSIKLAEIELIHDEVGEYPILLLDDVLSELDQHRQTQLIETFQHKVQTFITTTGIESVNLSKLDGADLFHVVQGQVEHKNT